MKKILITGANSYIGTSIEKYLGKWSEKYQVDTVDMIDDTWREKDFSSYDVVFHVAGIAHADTGHVSEERKAFYYKINTDLTIETAKKAKSDGVKQFIFMSSAIVYGDSAPIGKKKIITKDTQVQPANFYGDSKVQAEKGILPLQSDDFHVVVLRPPMIYGKGSKGNYPVLAKFAQKLPIFPYVDNERSMLYVENLAEFVRLMIENNESGFFHPQNNEYSNTAELVKMIAHAHGKKVVIIKGFGWALKLMSHMTGLVNKAFGSLSYDMRISEYSENYRVCGLEESIGRTEKIMPRVLFLVNHEVVIYNFRLEIVERLLHDGHEVWISSPNGEKIDELRKLGCHFVEAEISRHGMNPIDELKLLAYYKKIIKNIKPDMVFSYTIKPNIYGAMACKSLHVPCVANITGLGTAMENGGLSQKITVMLYRIAFSKIQKVFFQNKENMQFFIDRKLAMGKHDLLPGSGVNLQRFAPIEYPSDETIEFAFIARIMKEKGIDNYLEAARIIRKKYPNTVFHVCGFCEAEYDGKLQEYIDDNSVIYHGMVKDVRKIHEQVHCVIHPTYYPEGLSNVLLEACASARPIITTNRSGCREVVDNGINGFIVKQQDTMDLVKIIEKFIALSYEDKKKMGLAGRKKVEKEFDRKIVVRKYLNEIY